MKNEEEQQKRKNTVWKKEVGDPELAAFGLLTARGKSFKKGAESELLTTAVVTGSSQQKVCFCFGFWT